MGGAALETAGGRLIGGGAVGVAGGESQQYVAQKKVAGYLTLSLQAEEATIQN